MISYSSLYNFINSHNNSEIQVLFHFVSSFSFPKVTRAELDFDPKLFSIMFSTYIYFLKGDYISFTARLLFFYHSGDLLEHSSTLSIRWVQHHIPRHLVFVYITANIGVQLIMHFVHKLIEQVYFYPDVHCQLSFEILQLPQPSLQYLIDQ